MKITGRSATITATLLFAICTLLAMTIMAAEQKDQFERPTGSAFNALQVLEAALEHSASTENSVKVLGTAVSDALKFLPEQAPLAEQLRSAIAKQEAGGTAEDFVRAINTVVATLSFQPRKEGELPKGFPTYTAVGFIELKEYPVYRMAVAGNFWTLFRHIQSNNIPMTTPVEMKYATNLAGEFSQQSMAFLYGDAETGKLGREGKVDVVDVQPLSVVAIGVSGKRNQASVDRAQQYLLRWIEAHPDLVASGSTRVLGYNSPMVRQSNNFFEVQIPIRKLPAGIAQ